LLQAYVGGTRKKVQNNSAAWAEYVRPAALPWKLDTQFPSTAVSAPPGKSSTARSISLGIFGKPGTGASQRAKLLSGFAVQQ
jgi:hypothetical protein